MAALPLGAALAALLDGGSATFAAAKRNPGHGGSRRRRRKSGKHQNVREVKRKGKGKRKKRCAKAGQAPKKGRRCCAGLTVDGSGACAKAVAGCIKSICPPNPCAEMPDGCGGTQRCGCPGNQICVDGACRLCTVVCASGNAAACGDALQTDIDAAIADNGRTVYVCPGRYRAPNSDFNADGFRITGPVRIVGAGAEADAGSNTILFQDFHLGRVVDNSGGTSGNPVSLAGLRITGGTHGNGPEGGGFRNTGVMTMTDCTVIDNSDQSVGGGGANADGASLTMTGCTVTRNTSGAGGGLYNLDATLVLDACVVSENSSTGTGGGVNSLLLGAGASAELTLRNGTSIEGNTAASSGGGIYNRFGIVTIDASQVGGNKALSNFGGGVMNLAGDVLIANGSSIEGNTAEGGGGIYNGTDPATNATGTIVIDASSVTDNRAPGREDVFPGDGGGIANEPLSEVTLTDSGVTGNTASGEGAGIFNLLEGVVNFAGTTTVTGNTGGVSPQNCAGAGTYNPGTDGICGP